MLLLIVVYLSGRSSSKKDNPITIPGPGASQVATCAEACTRWDNARQMLCIAKTDEAAAKSRVESLRRDELAALATATSFTLAGGVALAKAAVATATVFGIPAGIILAALAASLFATAALAFGVALNFAGQLATAREDSARKVATRQEWDTEVASARAAVHQICTTAEGNNCLSIPAPC